MRFVRRHRLGLASSLFLATAAIDHRFGYPGDDWARYDHRTFTVGRVTAADAVQLTDGTDVRLLGLTDADPAAVDWLTGHALRRRVTLLLPAVGTRDPAGRLAAYLYTADDGACVNVALVRGGLARADRHSGDPMAGLFADAQRKAQAARADRGTPRHPTASP